MFFQIKFHKWWYKLGNIEENHFKVLKDTEFHLLSAEPQKKVVMKNIGQKTISCNSVEGACKGEA